MEGQRRQKWGNSRRSQNRKPPRANWQCTIPSWEKEFCRVVGSIDWETLLQMKKYIHLYENVINWDDSAGEEAFVNAKRRFWAEMHGRPCEISSPDPDLYIDSINWDSGIDPEPPSDFEFRHMSSKADNNHEPVIIFGDSLIPSREYSGWGDEEVKAPESSSPANNLGYQWEQNWGDSFNTGLANENDWQGYSNNQFTSRGDGWNNGWGWNYPNNNIIRAEVPRTGYRMSEGETGMWNNSNIDISHTNDGGHDMSHRSSRFHRDYQFGSHMYRNKQRHHGVTYWGEHPASDNRTNPRDWNSFNSCGRAH